MKKTGRYTLVRIKYRHMIQSLYIEMPGYIEFSNPVPFSFLNAPIRSGYPIMMKSLFTDNSAVYYEKGKQASCGVGTARNCGVKSKRI